jgi:hypothetical protein
MAPVDGDFKVVLKWADDDGRQAVNVFHLKATTGLPRFAADVLAQVSSGPGAAALGPVSGTAAVREIDVFNMFDESDAAVGVSGLSSWTGGGGAGDYSIGQSAILRLHTAFAGRSGKGRMFLPFLTEAAITKGRIVGDALTATAPAWASWFGDLEDDHTLTNTVWSEVLGTGHSVTGYAVNPIPGFRRRRANEA